MSPSLPRQSQEVNEKTQAEESRVRKFLFNEVTAAVAMVALIVGVITWVRDPQSQTQMNIALMQKDLVTITDNIKTINTNHETHIQDIFAQIKDLNIKIADENKNFQQNQLLLTQTQQLLKDHIETMVTKK